MSLSQENHASKMGPWNNPAFPVITIAVHFHDKLRLRFKLTLSA